MTNRHRKLALIHVAKRDLGLTDEEYRALLQGAVGVDSAGDILTDAQFRAVMDAFRRAGFSPDPPHHTEDRQYQRDLTSSNRTDAVQRYRSTTAPWRCYTRQRRKVEALWYERARVKTHEALSKFCRRTTGSDPEFMSPAQASHFIVALEKL